ncbi:MULTISPECIES: DUF5405 family protein [Citrobacter]|uniref:DUF5405 family protein n=1 Tax=Citrobacter TaxID=544 RepID=UPI00254C7AF8|nr:MULTISPECIES: DUF5405 family protein [Citrobacter]MDM3157631.1 DUF5405 family protein [Citrobacter sp. Cf122]
MSVLKSVILNGWLKVAVLKNGDLSLSDLKSDKESGLMVGSVIAIYSNELNLFSDVVDLIVKRAIYRKKITTVDELIQFMAEQSTYCTCELKKLNRKGGK